MKMKLARELRVVGIAVLSVLIFGQCNKNEIEEQFDCSTSSLAGSAETTASACGSATATIEVTTTGGLAPYLYKLDDGAVQAAGHRGRIGGSQHLFVDGRRSNLAGHVPPAVS